MTTRPRFQVDFNEMHSAYVVALSADDVKHDVEGRPVRLQAKMLVEVCEDDVDDNGAPNLLIGFGAVIPLPEDAGFGHHVKWWCRMDPPGHRHQSKIDRSE